jgi:methyl-accepting chemotaxis protein
VKFNNLKIGQKLQFYVLLVTVIIFVISIGYISLKDRERALRDAKGLIDSYASGYAESISNSFNQDMSTVRTLAQTFQVHRRYEVEEWKPLIIDMHRRIFENNPDFHALWDSWEFSYVDPQWNLPYGRFLNYHHRKNGQIGFDVLERSLTGDPPLYSAAKNAGKEKIWEPYPDQLDVGAVGTTLMTTLTVPMYVQGKYIGLVGVDITLEYLQNLISTIQPFDDSYAFLVSHSGLYAAHPVTSFLEMPLAENLDKDEAVYSITSRIKNGEKFSFSSSNEKGTRYYYTFAPVYIGDTGTPWSIGIAVPHNEIQKEATVQFLISLFIAMLGIGIIAVVVWFFSRSISVPVERITGLMQRLARGEIDQTMNIELLTGDELQQMAEAFNTSIKGLDEKTRFAESIGRGNLDTDLELLSEQDALGKSLKAMQADLKKARDEEKIRQEEDKIRSWSTEGFARFSDILRKNNNNMEELSFAIIKNLVKYLDANQGGIFIINDEDKNDQFLELRACYAYDRKKYLEKKIMPGEGLVGTCFKEGKTIYMTQIPQSYITITSGLGDESPGALVIVPLVLNDQVYGVIEIASFEEFKPYQIEFIEKIGESVASTISSVNISVHTALLLEKSQQQAEEMKAQEEEMRQNMEELHATQEEMARKNAETEGILRAIDASSYIIEYDTNGRIMNISDSFLNLLKLPRNEIIGTHHADRVEFSAQQQIDYEKFWSDLRMGKIRYQETKIKIHDEVFWLAETYSPIFDQNHQVVKVFKIANNITASKLEAEQYLEEINKLKEKLGEPNHSK